jgi:hypothetical protein
VVSTSHVTQLFVQFAHVTPLFVQLQTGSWNKRSICTDMAQGTKPDWVSCLVHVTSSATKKKLVGSESCLLFPLTCAWALTCHRFQGQTVGHLCLHAHQSSRTEHS